MKKILLSISVFSILILSCVAFYVDDYIVYGQSNIFWGSKGDEVKTVQTKLKDWGYYNGSIDGVYGYKMYESVKKFQKKNGLKQDGVVGNETKKALGIQTKTKKVASSRNDEIYLLSQAITGEARGEPYTGQVSVGAVILNRTKDSRFPHSIAGVIYQPGAFTAVDDGQINMKPTQSCIQAANDAINGWDPTGGAVYYWNPATATSKWIWKLKPIYKIGKHWFAKETY
ncbi:spore cortex-lytic enzyme [Tepidibacter hydrothermalis]|uniref:spore cortex-lytic enzyme n=1 Tax=Tepidibacter hydrothermalis TaxID=3036126 RepID=UPI002F42D6FC